MTPVRIQRKRIKGWRMPPNTVYVGRPGKWGNVFTVGQGIPFLPGRKVEDNRHAVSLYLGHAPLQPRLVAAAKRELRGVNLACWCPLCDLHANGLPVHVQCPYCAPCHVDVLLEIANG